VTTEPQPDTSVPTMSRSGPPVRRAWAAYAISQAGSGIGTGALPLVAILLLDASDWQISLLAAAAGITGAVAVVPLGPWVEFHRKRPVMVGADLLRGVTLLSVPVAAWAGGLTFGQLCLVAAAQTVGTILSSAASTAFLKSLVPGDQLVLVDGRWESTMWTASTFGPPAGGMLVGCRTGALGLVDGLVGRGPVVAADPVRATRSPAWPARRAERGTWVRRSPRGCAGGVGPAEATLRRRAVRSSASCRPARATRRGSPRP
jgi:hypothetical protein